MWWIPGFPIPGFPIPGFPIRGFPIPGFPIPGFPIRGFPIRGFPIPGWLLVSSFHRFRWARGRSDRHFSNPGGSWPSLA